MESDTTGKSLDGQPLRLLLPDGTTADVFESEPEGADYKLGLLAGKRKLRLKASALPPGTADAQSGEVIDNPVQFFRRAWCTAACVRYGGWRLEDLINALPIEGLGPSTAAKYPRRLEAGNVSWQHQSSFVRSRCHSLATISSLNRWRRRIELVKVKRFLDPRSQLCRERLPR